MVNFDRVFPEKIESAYTGGTQENTRLTALNPKEDGLIVKGLGIHHNEADPYQGTIGQVIDCDENGNLRFKDTLTGTKLLSELAEGGGGSGSSFTLNLSEGNIAPTTEYVSGVKLYYFSYDDDSQYLNISVYVPKGFVSSQLKLRMAIYCFDSNNDDVRFKTTSTLHREGLLINNTTNQHTSTNSAIAVQATQGARLSVELDLTDGDGEINSLSVAEYDMLQVKLERDNTINDNVASLVAIDAYSICII